LKNTKERIAFVLGIPYVIGRTRLYAEVNILTGGMGMAELREVITRRRSVQKYKKELIPREDIEEIIKLAV